MSRIYLRAATLLLLLIVSKNISQGEFPCQFRSGSNDYKCQNGRCIPRGGFCDTVNHCSDGSDEYTDPSLVDGIMCQYNRRSPVDKTCVLPNVYKCDHEVDCMGGSDECDCDHTFRCDNGDCVSRDKFCQSDSSSNNCKDGTDEREFNRTSGEGFQCPVTRTHWRNSIITKTCVLPDRYVCDGTSDCDSGIDECFCDFSAGEKKGLPLNDVSLNEKCFRCSDGSLVIPISHHCDGIVHCEDLSDECVCPEKAEHDRPAICDSICKGPDCDCPGQLKCFPKLTSTTINPHFPLPAEINRTVCIDPTSICDDVFDCENQIDEKVCSLDNSTFFCYDGSRKIRQYSVCDGEADCDDGSDELNCHELAEFSCGDWGRKNEYKCQNGRCIHRWKFCNKVNDCSDGSDEYNDPSLVDGIMCKYYYGFVNKTCVLPNVYNCDHQFDCFGGSDECDCEDTFKCDNGDCAWKDDFCKRDLYRANCVDGTDQREFNRTSGEGFQCPVTHTTSWEKTITKTCVLPDRYVCDGTSDCDSGIDECFCDFSAGGKKGLLLNDVYLNGKCFRCFDGLLVIPISHLCDGIVHCVDFSDECVCPEKNGHDRPTICDSICKGPDCDCPSQLKCLPKLTSTTMNPHSTVCIDHTSICDDVFDCENQLDEIFCSNYFLCYDGSRKILQDYVCNGEADCNDGSDELNCDRHFGTFFCPAFYLNPFYGPSYTQKCDGIPSCRDYLNRLGMSDEVNCTGRFYCHKMDVSRLPIHIPMERKCDGNKDCDDISDELNCSKTRVYCEDEGSTFSVPLSQVCDGIKDCKDGNDECQNCNLSPISSDNKLISSKVLFVFLWIIGITAVGGNITVIIYEIINLVKPTEKHSPVAVGNRLLVLNLSASNLLVGIYLVGLGVKDASVSKYCLLDQEWRSSSTCSALGSLALIGIETSVFILSIMTAYRMYVVVRPFRARAQKKLIVVMPIAAAWTISFVFAFAPLIKSTQDYFVSCVCFPLHHFFDRVCRKDLEKFTKDLVLFEGSNKTFSKAVEDGYTWTNMFSAMEKLNSSYVPELYFGYYSAHSVCLPRFFTDPNSDEVWGYSLFLMLVNFFAFLVILICYICIYRIATNSNVRKTRSEERDDALQRKVTRIVLTDFCCWMPICIMAIIKLSGVPIPDESYAVTAIILLSINSAMNPFLFSDILDIIWRKLLPVRKRFNETLCRTKLANKTKDRRDKQKNETLLGETRSAGATTGQPMQHTNYAYGGTRLTGVTTVQPMQHTNYSETSLTGVTTGQPMQHTNYNEIMESDLQKSEVVMDENSAMLEVSEKNTNL